MLLWNNYQVLCCCDFDGIFWFLCKCHTVLLKCYCSILNSIFQAFTGLFFNTIGSFNIIVLGPYNIVILKKNALFLYILYNWNGILVDIYLSKLSSLCLYYILYLSPGRNCESSTWEGPLHSLSILYVLGPKMDL